MNQKEKLFFDKLKDIFIGAKIEGDSGFINLMRIKSAYFDVIFSELQKEINEKTKEFPEFKEEMFDKLYTFFKTYFSESGSIYFSYTPLKSKVYEKIYTSNKDVILFWKTHMLYYVKTDKLWNNLILDFDENGVKYKIHFDVSKLEHKKANEKKSIIYELKSIKDKEIIFTVLYSEKGRKTKTSDILKEFKKKSVHLDEERLDRILKIFEKQNEVDYFINKDAEKFLKEQFSLWLKTYVLDDKSIFKERRLQELNVLKDIAYKVIDFVAQFEDELVKIWNKPKFVVHSNYVITLDRISDTKFVEKIIKDNGFSEQLKEWKELGILDKFEKNKLFNGKDISKEYSKLPIDTKYFSTDIKLELLSLFDNLDKQLDGWLIHSENYQALKTILPKFKERVQTCYIDPPFNLGTNADFLYNVNYKDANWITLIENRLNLIKDMLCDKGNIFLRCDYNGNMFIRLLMNQIFGEDNFMNEIIVGKTSGKKKMGLSLSYSKDYLLFFSKSNETVLNPLEKDTEEYEIYEEIMDILESNQIQNLEKIKEVLKEELFWLDLDHRPGERKTNKERCLLNIKFDPPKGRHWIKSQIKLDELHKKGYARIKCKSCGKTFYNKEDLKKECCKDKKFIIQVFIKSELLTENWTDISGYSQSLKFPTENSEILLKRCIETSSKQRQIVIDFFLGSGTTVSVSHKLNRRWIGVELGEHFNDLYYDNDGNIKIGVLGRMKRVLYGDKSGISRDINWQGGGFFKYYEVEQYEQALKKVAYKKSHPFLDLKDKSIYQQYVFMKDLKLLEAMELDYKNNKIKVDFSKIYPNIDLAETLSNLTGKSIKKIAKDSVEFDDGEKIKFDNIDFNLIKPLIWW